MVSGSDWRDFLEPVGGKVERTAELLDGVSGGESVVLKPFTDFDGPVRRRSSGGDVFHRGVSDGFDALIESEDILNPGIISGRGTGFLLEQVDILGLEGVDVAGEMGAVYYLAEDLESVADARDPRYVVPEGEVGREDIYRFNMKFFEALAEEGVQFMYGDNKSNVVGSAALEAVGVNLDQDRFSVEGTVYEHIYSDSNVQNVISSIKNYPDTDVAELFEFQNDEIRFEKDLAAVEAVTNAFIGNPFIPWRFYDLGSELAMVPSYEADENFGYDEFESMVDSITEEINKELDADYWSSPYHDFSFDFGIEGYQNLKTRAAQTIISEQNIPDQGVVLTNTGDKPTDIIQLEQSEQQVPYVEGSLFFAQENTEAEEYCLENDIDHISVESFTESSYIQNQVASGV